MWRRDVMSGRHMGAVPSSYISRIWNFDRAVLMQHFSVGSGLIIAKFVTCNV